MVGMLSVLGEFMIIGGGGVDMVVIVMWKLVGGCFMVMMIGLDRFMLDVVIVVIGVIMVCIGVVFLGNIGVVLLIVLVNINGVIVVMLNVGVCVR